MRKRIGVVVVVLLLAVTLMACCQVPSMSNAQREETSAESKLKRPFELDQIYPSPSEYEEYEQRWKESYRPGDDAYEWQYRMYQIDHAIPTNKAYACELNIATYANLLVPHSRLSSGEQLRLTMELPRPADKQTDVACTLIYPGKVDQGERAEICAVAKTDRGEMYIGKCEIEALEDLHLIHGDTSQAYEDGFMLAYEGDKVFFDIATLTTDEAIPCRPNVYMCRGDRLEAAHFVRTAYIDFDYYNEFDEYYAVTAEPGWEYGTRYVECDSYAVTPDGEKLAELPAESDYYIIMELPECPMRSEGHYDVGVGYEQRTDVDEWKAYIVFRDVDAQVVYRSEVALPLGSADPLKVGLGNGDHHDDSCQLFMDKVKVYFSTNDIDKTSDHAGYSGYGIVQNFRDSMYFSYDITPSK